VRGISELPEGISFTETEPPALEHGFNRIGRTLRAFQS
jgi:hypothetical protein